MVQYTCKKCSQTFDRKNDYDRHLRRTTDCSSGSKTNKKVTHVCKKCNRCYTRKDSLTRHMKNCKKVTKKTTKKKKTDVETNITGDNNKTKIAYNSDNCNNKNTCVINLFINCNEFGKDGTNNISASELSKILNSGQNIFHSMIELVNFNPDKPQHHNVYCPNLKDSHGIIYENKNWIKKKIQEIMNTLLDAKMDDLNDILNEMGACLSKRSIRKIREALKNADYSKPDSRKNLISYLKPILYNNKDMIIKTRNVMEGNDEEEFDDNELKGVLKKGKTKKDFLKAHKKMVNK